MGTRRVDWINLAVWAAMASCSAAASAGADDDGDPIAAPVDAAPAAEAAASAPDLARAPDVASAAEAKAAPDAGASATRPSAQVVDVSAGLPGKLQMMAAVPGRNKVVALSGEWNITGSVWATTDGGATWVEQGKGAGSLPLKMLPLGILMDPGDPERFWTWGNWTSGNTGILQTTDGGRTLASAHAYEAEGLSVDFGDPMRRTMVYGQHEATRSVFRSGNGGQTWTQIGKTLPADSAMSEFPLVVDDHTFLIGCSFMTFGTPPPRGTAGIFRTADSGATWTRVAPQAVFRSPLVVDGTIYWSYYNVETKDGGLVRSDDHGATWKVVTASGLKYRQIPMALPDGRIATLRANNALVISTDGGATWAEARPAPTMKPVSGATFNDVLGAFFVWEGAGHAQRVDLGP